MVEHAVPVVLLLGDLVGVLPVLAAEATDSIAVERTDPDPIVTIEGEAEGIADQRGRGGPEGPVAAFLSAEKSQTGLAIHPLAVHATADPQLLADGHITHQIGGRRHLSPAITIALHECAVFIR